MFSQALGMSKFQFIKHYEFLGYPMVDTRARFLKPAKFGDDVTVETTVTEFRRSSFDVRHRLMQQRRARGGMLRHPGVGGARSRTTRRRSRRNRSPHEVIAKFNAG